jgi:hypothetical protein
MGEEIARIAEPEASRVGRASPDAPIVVEKPAELEPTVGEDEKDSGFVPSPGDGPVLWCGRVCQPLIQRRAACS